MHDNQVEIESEKKKNKTLIKDADHFKILPEGTLF